MRWNPLVPELMVENLSRSLRFYTEGIGFSVAFRRTDPDFAYLDLDGAQIMLEADHESAWRTGFIEHPRGRGLNLQVEVPDVHAARARLLEQGATAFRDVHDSWYKTAEGEEGQREFLIQDPDGYLIRLVEVLPPRA